LLLGFSGLIIYEEDANGGEDFANCETVEKILKEEKKVNKVGC
jgi:hypothetical protein